LEGYAALAKALETYPPLVDSYIEDIVQGDPEYLYEASLHLVRAGGKRLRPVLVLLTAKFLGGPRAEAVALPFAAAVEIFHTFTLIHDDIMDEDPMRRGVPAVHVKWGVPTAILAGDLLHTLSYKAILAATRYFERGDFVDELSEFTAGKLLEAVDAFTEASVKISRGQAYDMMFEERGEVSYHDYLKMVYLKTGALFEASAKLGAIAAGENSDVVDLMGLYGRLVGIAFQIKDDILGIFGVPEVTGKPVYNDLRRGKKTLLVLYALEKAQGDAKELLRAVISGERVDEESLKAAAKIIEETGALDYAVNMAHRYSRTAAEVLEKVNEAAGKDEDAYHALKELAAFAVEREK